VFSTNVGKKFILSFRLPHMNDLIKINLSKNENSRALFVCVHAKIVFPFQQCVTSSTSTKLIIVIFVLLDGKV
jgi:hypothetical protein